MYFYLNVFQVNAKIISAVFLIGGIWDIINNPLIGMMIDHKNNALGKQTEIIRHFTPLQCMVTILIFMGPIFIKKQFRYLSLKNHLSCTNLFLWEFFYSVTDVAFGDWLPSSPRSRKTGRRPFPFRISAISFLHHLL